MGIMMSMKAETRNFLLDLNRRFYEDFAREFSATRQRLQPGVEQALAEYIWQAGEGLRILDLGCGNGELARRLAREGFRGSYIGLDFSAGLLEEAARHQPPSSQAEFFQADLGSEAWRSGETAARLSSFAPFDRVLAFAVLHHLPGRALHRQVLQGVHRLLTPQGVFLHSEWQFLNSQRLVERIQPWEAVALPVQELEAGDYLLDWRSGGKGLRYVHHFSEAELELLAQESGFEVLETFYSDGQGGQLGLYQAWRKQAPGA